MPSTETRQRMRQAIEAKKLGRTNKSVLMSKLSQSGMMDQMNQFNSFMDYQKSQEQNDIETRKLRQEMVAKMQKEGNFQPTAKTMRIIMNRLLTDKSLSVEQAEKMRAMIITYQKSHVGDQLTNDWKSIGIDA